MSNEPIISDEELFQDIHLGHKAEQFLKHTPLGKQLVQRAADEWKNAMFAFQNMTLEVILASPEKIAALHQKMQVSRSFIVWMNESITNADRAERELGNRDVSDGTID